MAKDNDQKVGHYVLKEGVKHSFIIDGERVRVVGDGKGTVPMSEKQADNFKEKIKGEGKAEARLQDAAKAEAAAAVAKAEADEEAAEELAKEREAQAKKAEGGNDSKAKK